MLYCVRCLFGFRVLIEISFVDVLFDSFNFLLFFLILICSDCMELELVFGLSFKIILM